MIRRYAVKSSKLMRHEGAKREDDSEQEPHREGTENGSGEDQGWELQKEHADTVMLLMWLGCKLASQQLDKPA